MAKRRTQYPIERRSLSAQVYQYIKHLILSGRLTSGQRIPEEAISQELDVSRTPVREALRQLHEYGLVVIKPRSHAKVAELDAEEAGQVTCVRAELEALAGRLLTARATPQDVYTLRDIAGACDRELAGGDLGAAFEHDSYFHLEIARRCGNRFLLELMERLDAKVQMLRLTKCVATDGVHPAVAKHGAIVAEHEAIIAAIEAGDAAEAAALMKRHAHGMLSHSDAGREASA